MQYSSKAATFLKTFRESDNDSLYLISINEPTFRKIVETFKLFYIKDEGCRAAIATSGKGFDSLFLEHLFNKELLSKLKLRIR